MDAAWRGSIAQMATELPYFIENITVEEHAQCLGAVANLPFPDYQVALGISANPEWIHCYIQTPSYGLIIRFVPSDSPKPSDWDKVASQARKLASADALQGHRIYASIIPVKSKQPHILGQTQSLPLDRLGDFIDALNDKEKAETASMPDVSLIQPSAERETDWAQNRLHTMQKLTDAFFGGWLSTAAEYAASLQKIGQALYVSHDLALIETYCRERGESIDMLISPRSYNLLLLRNEKVSQDTASPRRISLLAWGDDMRWLGRWRPAGDETEKALVLNFYRQALLCASEGVLVYLPQTPEMLGTLRAFHDGGFRPLS